MSNRLNRLGDTSLRVSNQVKFYQEIITLIYNNGTNEFIEVENIWCEIKNKILNYKDKKVKHDKFWVSVLKKFGIIQMQENKVKMTKLGNSIFRIIDNCKDQKFDILGSIWFYLLINSHEISNDFRNLVVNTYKEQNITKEKIISFISPNFNVNNKTFSKEDINKILKNNSLQIVFNLKKSSIVNYSLPKLINCLTSNEEVTRMLDEDKKLMTELKRSFSYYNNCPPKKRILNSEILNYIFQRKELLINDIYNIIKMRTIYKDYYDINLRWFKQTNFLIIKENEISINKTYEKIYQKLLKIPFDNELNNLEIFLSKEELQISPTQWPYNEGEVLNMFCLINENKWIQLKEYYKLENISNSTIFEYIVNLIFCISINVNIDDFRKRCNTILDDDLKPWSHAPGGRADGVLNYNQKQYTIESTILNNLEQLLSKEKYPIQRHAIQMIDKNKNNIPIIIFVIKDNWNEKILNHFITQNSCKYYNDQNKNIITILLSCSDMINFISKNRLRNVLDLYKNLPLIEKNNMNLTLSYREILKKI